MDRRHAAEARLAIGKRSTRSPTHRSSKGRITVHSVEIREIKIPDNLQDAMSR